MSNDRTFTFVLVHGYWLGGWVWADVAGRLTAAGHDVRAPSVSRDRDADLESEIAEIIEAIGDARDVVLVAHSGGGVAVGAVADRVTDRLAHVVYLDSAPLPDGMAQIELNPPEVAATIRAAIVDGVHPMPPWDELLAGGTSLDGLTDAHRELLTSKSRPQPERTFTTPVRRAPSPPAVPQTLIKASLPPELIADHPLFAEVRGPRWTIVPLPTGHYPMLSRPDDVAALLLAAAEGSDLVDVARM